MEGGSQFLQFAGFRAERPWPLPGREKFPTLPWRGSQSSTEVKTIMPKFGKWESSWASAEAVRVGGDGAGRDARPGRTASPPPGRKPGALRSGAERPSAPSGHVERSPGAAPGDQLPPSPRPAQLLLLSPDSSL